MRTSLILLTILVACVAGGCSNPESEARKELQNRRYHFTADDFLRAAGNGDLPTLILFGKAGIDVNITNAAGRTALMAASGKGETEAVKLLLAAGADPRMVDSKGRSALISAAGGGHAKIAQLLISRGADRKVRDHEGWSALTLAAYKGEPDLVRILAGQAGQENLDEALLLGSLAGDRKTISNLLSQGAFVDSRSKEGLTPLMIVAKTGKYDIAALLLQNRADPDSLGPDGTNAGTMAKNAGHEKVHHLIIEGGLKGEIENEDVIRAATMAAQKKPVPILRKGETKPLVALNGSTIRTRTSQKNALNYFKVSEFEERVLPVALKEVDGFYATITRLDPGGVISHIRVAKGDLIPGTNYRLQEIEPKKVRSNGLPETTIDTTRVRVQNIKTKGNHLLVKNAKTKPVDTWAVITANNSNYRYVTRIGDIFQIVDPDHGERDYQVIAVSQTDVAVKELTSSKIVRVSQASR